MDTKDLLTVKEFAEAAGVSRQRIYKLMVDSLQPYIVKQENGYTLIKSEALGLFGKAVELKPCNPTELKPCNSTQSSSNKENEPNLVDSVQPDRVDSVQQQESPPDQSDIVGLLQKTIDELTKQLDVKDHQIAFLQGQIVELTEDKKALRLEIKAAQALHAGTLQIAGAGQSSGAAAQAQSEGEPSADKSTGEAQSETRAETAPEPVKKKGLFERIFGRK